MTYAQQLYQQQAYPVYQQAPVAVPIPQQTAPQNEGGYADPRRYGYQGTQSQFDSQVDS
jgi:hypothetical protein